MFNVPRLGAVLVGAGLGILGYRLVPSLEWLWPVGFIVAGAIVWRRPGTIQLALGVLAASTTIGLMAAGPMLPRPAADLATPIATFEQTSQQQPSWQQIEHLNVKNGVGNIVIEGGHDAVEVSVEYRRHRAGGSIPEGLKAEYSELLNELTVVGIDPARTQAEQTGIAASVTVRVPRVSVTATGKVGDVSVANVTGAEILNDVGDIKLREVAGTVTAATDVGNIQVDNVSGPVTVSARVGELRLAFDRPVEAPVNAKADVGDISLVLPSASNVSVRAASHVRSLTGDLEPVTASEGRLRLGPGEHAVELVTRVGEVSVQLR